MRGNSAPGLWSRSGDRIQIAKCSAPPPPWAPSRSLLTCHLPLSATEERSRSVSLPRAASPALQFPSCFPSLLSITSLHKSQLRLARMLLQDHWLVRSRKSGHLTLPWAPSHTEEILIGR